MDENPLAFGKLKLFSLKNSLNLSLKASISTDLYGFVGSPNFSET